MRAPAETSRREFGENYHRPPPSPGRRARGARRRRARGGANSSQENERQRVWGARPRVHAQGCPLRHIPRSQAIVGVVPARHAGGRARRRLAGGWGGARRYKRRQRKKKGPAASQRARLPLLRPAGATPHATRAHLRARASSSAHAPREDRAGRLRLTPLAKIAPLQKKERAPRNERKGKEAQARHFRVLRSGGNGPGDRRRVLQHARACSQPRPQPSWRGTARI